MIEKIAGGYQNLQRNRSLYAEARVEQNQAQFFSITVDGTIYELNDPKQTDQVRRFLNLPGINRKETVAAVLYKGMEPTLENLDAVHRALNESAIDSVHGVEEVSSEAAFDAEIIDQWDLPQDLRDRLKKSVRDREFNKTVKAILEQHGKSSGEDIGSTHKLSLKEALVLLKKIGSSLRSRSAAESPGIQTAEQQPPHTAEGEVPADGSLSGSKDGLFSEFSEGFRVDLLQGAFSDGILPNYEALLLTSAEKHGVGNVFSDAISDVAYAEKPDPKGFLNFESERFDGKHLNSDLRLRLDVMPADQNGDNPIPSGGFVRRGESEMQTLPKLDEKESLSLSSDDAEERESPDEVRSEKKVKFAEESNGQDAFSERNIEQMVLQALSSIDSGLANLFEELEIKQFLVAKTTEMLRTSANEFRVFQNELEAISKKVTPQSVRRSIESLTKLIHKSTFAMLTDMKTEKQLLISLSRLEEASLALKNKNMALAERIVREVAATVRSIEFKPSVTKVHAMVLQKVQSNEKVLEERNIGIRQHMEDAIRLFSSGTARDILELIRFTGVNHEVERYENSQTAGSIKNLKELFPNHSFASYMSGQQMLNNSSDERKRDFYTFEIPLAIHEEIAGLKVVVGGKTAENQLDWKNAELYFALKLNAQDKIGLRFLIKDGNVKIEMSGRGTPDLRNLKGPLEEIGYRLISVKDLEQEEIRKLPLTLTESRTDSDAGTGYSPNTRFEAKI